MKKFKITVTLLSLFLVLSLVATTAFAQAPITSTLRQGSRGNQVTVLQNRLNQLGFNCGRPDGMFGRGTRNAVMAFQRKNSLKADGIVGKGTIAKLFATPNTANHHNPNNPNTHKPNTHKPNTSNTISKPVKIYFKDVDTNKDISSVQTKNISLKNGEAKWIEEVGPQTVNGYAFAKSTVSYNDNPTPNQFHNPNTNQTVKFVVSSKQPHHSIVFLYKKIDWSEERDNTLKMLCEIYSEDDNGKGNSKANTSINVGKPYEDDTGNIVQWKLVGKGIPYYPFAGQELQMGPEKAIYYIIKVDTNDNLRFIEEVRIADERTIRKIYPDGCVEELTVPALTNEQKEKFYNTFDQERRKKKETEEEKAYEQKLQNINNKKVEEGLYKTLRGKNFEINAITKPNRELARNITKYKNGFTIGKLVESPYTEDINEIFNKGVNQIQNIEINPHLKFHLIIVPYKVPRYDITENFCTKRPNGQKIGDSNYYGIITNDDRMSMEKQLEWQIENYKKLSKDYR